MYTHIHTYIYDDWYTLIMYSYLSHYDKYLYSLQFTEWMKSKIELLCPEQLELQRYQFNILQYGIAVASTRKK